MFGNKGEGLLQACISSILYNFGLSLSNLDAIGTPDVIKTIVNKVKN